MVTAKKITPKTNAIKVVAGTASAPSASSTAGKAVAANTATAEKPAPKSAPKVPPKPGQAEPVKARKPKLVRDGFTIPKSEYMVLDELKLRAASLRYPTKKSELIRAGIKALAAMQDNEFLAVLLTVPTIKTGRPGKHG